MGLLDLFVAVLIAGVSCINASVPAGAYLRSHDGRFLALTAANAMLLLFGALSSWGELPLNPPSWTVVPLPLLVVILVASVLLLSPTLWRRRA